MKVRPQYKEKEFRSILIRSREVQTHSNGLSDEEYGVQKVYGERSTEVRFVIQISISKFETSYL